MAKRYKPRIRSERWFTSTSGITSDSFHMFAALTKERTCRVTLSSQVQVPASTICDYVTAGAASAIGVRVPATFVVLRRF